MTFWIKVCLLNRNTYISVLLFCPYIESRQYGFLEPLYMSCFTREFLSTIYSFVESRLLNSNFFFYSHYTNLELYVYLYAIVFLLLKIKLILNDVVISLSHILFISIENYICFEDNIFSDNLLAAKRPGFYSCYCLMLYFRVNSDRLCCWSKVIPSALTSKGHTMLPTNALSQHCVTNLGDSFKVP